MFLNIFLLSSPTLYYALLKAGTVFSVTFLLYCVFSFTLFFLPVVILQKFYKIYLYIIGLIVPFSSGAYLYLYLYSERLNPNIFASILETNLNEAAEFLSGYGLLLTLLIIIPSVLYYYSVYKTKFILTGKKRIFFSAIPVLLSVLLINVKPPHVSYRQSLSMKFVNIYPFYIYNSYNIYLDEKEKITDRINKINSFKFNAVNHLKDINNRKIFILVIGESARYDNWSINGYYRNTSPLLESLQNVVSFNDVSASGTLTRLSVPLILTRADPKNYNLSYVEKNILGLFKEADYKTVWISNQEVLGVNGTAVSEHAAEADKTIYINRAYATDFGFVTVNNVWEYDGRLIQYLEDAILEDDRDMFIVLHTIGSHYRYNIRYPAEFAKFLPEMSEKDRINSVESRDNIINSYDNSIYYTDFVLFSIIDLIKQKCPDSVSSLLYVSDHGEELFDKNKSLGHGVGISIKKIHIPMFVWCSDAYINEFDYKFQSMISNKNTPLSQTNIFHTLADIANISFSKYQKELSFADTCLINLPRLFLTPYIENKFTLFNYDSLKVKEKVSF